MSSQPEIYQYDALPDDASIRILTLRPGSPDDPLHGDLDIVNIEAAGSYEPLSYVWGDATRTHTMLLSDGELPLTTSLYHALRRIRLPGEPRRIWADQICINQENVSERSGQVQFMNSIYRNARHVLVWLGQDEQNVAEESFGRVRELDKIFADEAEHRKFSLDHTDHLEDQSRDSWAPLNHITALPWVSSIQPHSRQLGREDVCVLRSLVLCPVRKGMDSSGDRHTGARNPVLGEVSH